MLDEASANRIALYIPQDGQQVPILLYRESLVRALPHSTARAVAKVVPVGMGGLQPMHPSADVDPVLGADDQMKMVWHHTCGEEIELDPLLCFANQGNERSVLR
jgi:hypothetical protein